jgi:hypothetical protein
VTLAIARESRLDRLRRAVAATTSAQDRPAYRPRLADALALRQILRVESIPTSHGPVYVRDDWFAPDHEHGALPLSAPLGLPVGTLGHLAVLAAKSSPASGAAPLDASQLAFFDIETTGLAGGSGTYVVIAGIGSYERDGFRVRQYFLADVGEERGMLAHLAEELSRFRGVVTYNGRAFDVPVLESRLAMTRLATPCSRLAHIDLLHAVRRLFGHRMPACRLAEAEQRLLGVNRIDDVPGALIPSLYFDYVRAQRIAPLNPVFRHNADDVLSMVGVLAHVARLLAGGPLDPEDAVAVARWWERAGFEARALTLYREALPWLEGEPDWAWAASRCARLCRRAGLRPEAASLWRSLWEQGDAAAGLELAKHYEHHARDFAEAERVTLKLLEHPGAAVNDGSLLRRLARVRRKLGAARWT